MDNRRLFILKCVKFQPSQYYFTGLVDKRSMETDTVLDFRLRDKMSLTYNRLHSTSTKMQDDVIN